MIIRTGNLFKHYTKIDNYVTANKQISDGAFRVYTYYAGLKDGNNFVDEYVMKALNISQKVLTNRKSELKKAGLILSDRIASRIYVLYIGNSKISAARLKKAYELDEKKNLALGNNDE